MPRDLFALHSTTSSNPPQEGLVSSPESRTPAKQEGDEETTRRGDEYNEFTIHRDERQLSIQMLRDNRAKADDRNELHPYVQTLSLSDLESCKALEDAIFPEQERCTTEKFNNRLTVCPELSLGLFSTMSSPPSTDIVPTYPPARPAFSSRPDHKQTLIAMIVATKSTAEHVTDASMELSPRVPGRPQPPAPPSPLSQSQPVKGGGEEVEGGNRRDEEIKGHQEEGRTICIHSFGVLPAYQGRGLGKVLMKSYQQRMETSGIADRIALLCHEGLLSMYTGMGFSKKGKSGVRFGGGGWTDLTYEFADKGLGS